MRQAQERDFDHFAFLRVGLRPPFLNSGPGLKVSTTPEYDPSKWGYPTFEHLLGRYGSDDTLLDLGAAYEASFPWSDRWPALA